jgi:hypothetical protein
MMKERVVESNIIIAISRFHSHFLMRFDSPAASIVPLKDEYFRDVDIIRAGFVKEKLVVL